MKNGLEESGWTPIPSFPGYEISSSGTVRDKYNGRMLSVSAGSVTLQKGKKRYSRSIRVLQAEVASNG